MRVSCFLALSCVLIHVPVTQADTPINPIPRATKATTLATWDFAQGVGSWVAQSQCTLAADSGLLRVQSTGSDPYFDSRVDLQGGQVVVQLRVRSTVGGSGSVFWTTDKLPHRGEDKRADFRMPGDGKWLETSTRFNAPGRLRDLRIDPGVKPGLIEIDWIRVVHEELHPLTISSVVQDDKVARFEITNQRNTAVSFTEKRNARTIEGHGKLIVERRIVGARQVEPLTVTLVCDGWPLLERTVWAVTPQAPCQWLEKSIDGFALKIARDGSVVQILDKDRLVATVGPMVIRNGELPTLRLESSGRQIRFVGDGIALALTPSGREIEISIESDQPCEGPVVRAMGGLEQGLLAGLEYLGKGERSSSKLDIRSAGYLRFSPDPLKVTMPLMAVVTDRASVALTWTDMQLQPVYATPNFFDGTSDHRMALQGTRIQASLRLGKDTLEESIHWAVKKKGLPPVPAAPRSTAEQKTICLTALNGPLKTEKGWGHCVQERWGRQPFSDMASTVWRLGGDVPNFGRLVHGGAHVRNGTIYFVTGRAQEWLEIQRREVKGKIAQQQPDGSYRYAGKYAEGHFEDTASGVCAWPAARLLEFAYVTGDKEALDAGLRTLDYAKRFRTPRGAQVWECPLHTPDQLASAYLVWAFTRGYQLTGDEEYLRHARKWALSGIPFTYMWSNYPVMAYATPPVYGATNWIAPNWMGLPVQWVGGVYAYALTILAPHEKSLDWNQVARGILVSAQQQQYPDGHYIGLLPDSFNIPSQRRQPADINPCALVSLQMALDGEVDFLSVATVGKRRVAAPFPVTLRDGAAHVQAKKGVNYQILVDGKAVIDVRSQGKDVVALPN